MVKILSLEGIKLKIWSKSSWEMAKVTLIAIKVTPMIDQSNPK